MKIFIATVKKMYESILKSNYTNYELKWVLKGEVAFVLYNASIIFHSSATKNMSKEVKNEMDENFWFILNHNLNWFIKPIQIKLKYC